MGRWRVRRQRLGAELRMVLATNYKTGYKTVFRFQSSE